MFCPHCKCEYRDGFTTCADCDIPRVAELSVEPVSESVQQTSQNTLVPVLETYNQHDIAIIKSALDAAGIIYHFSGETIHMMGVRPLPARLLVASDRIEDATAILSELELL